MRVKMFAMTAAAAVLALLGMTAPAANAASPPSGCYEYFSLVGTTCYEWDGDDQWVRDDLDDGWNTRVQVETDYGKVRWCAPTNGEAYGSWRECNYDHLEHTCVHFRLYEQLGADNTKTQLWSYWSPWVSTSTGREC